MKRTLSFILALVLLIGLVPMQVFATEGTQEVEVAHEHDYEAVVTAPTCTEKGYTTYTCTCGDSYRISWLDESAYEGKTIACIGDSITAAVGVTKDENDYVKLLADRLSMNYIRLGASGTTLCTDGSRTCNIGRLTEGYLKNADIVTIAMGINDFCAAGEGYYELGGIISTDSSTIYGAVRMWCERIEELRATDSLCDTQFYFVTPVICSWNNSVTNKKNWDQSKENIHGYTLRDLCNAIIEVAELYDVGVIDLNLLSGMYYVDAENNNTAVFGGDGVHPGAGGHAMMANAIANALLQNNLRDDHAHTFGSWITTTWPSCTEGEQQRVCSVCSAVEHRSAEPAKDHTYVSAITVPTCTERGYTTYTCVCGDSYVDDYVDAAGHSDKNGICSICGVALVETVANGTCGDNLAWTLDENGVLTISGTGKMYDYGYRPAEERVVMPPWNAHKNDITTVVMEDGITHIGQMAFEGCSNLTGIELSEDLTAIGNNAFSNCSSLANVRLPETLTSMGNFAFSGCKSLTNMEIPAGVTTIGTHAFSNCSALVEIDLPDGITQISERMFNDCAALASIEIPTGITGIGDYAFFGCKSLETIELPDGVVSIGESAFDNCTNLASVKLPDSLTGIGNNAFSACSSLVNINIPAGITTISDYMFFSCHSLTDIQIPEGVTAIGDWAFYGCGLTDINLPDTVTTIGAYAYYSCDYLTAIALPDSVTSIGDHAFCDCIRLTEIKLPAGLISIGNTVFEMCKSLEKITFTGDAPDIAESAFADVTATAYYPSNNATWSAMARQNYGATALTWTAYTTECEHTYTSVVTAPTCTEQGYTTYTCTLCGDSYVADLLDVTGHTYKNGICTGCGAEHPNLANYEDKVISILGDSISTFAGYIPVADGFNLQHYARYPQDNLFTEVEHTWWMQVLTALDAKLGINESWRSTEVGNIYDVEVNSGYEGTKACMASITRIQNLGSNGTPDVILFYGGTNDITQRRTVGTFNPVTAPTEVDLTSVKWDTVADAYVAAIMRMQHYYPDAEIIAMLPAFTSKNTDAVIEEYNSVFAAICEHYGVTYIDLRDCGITTANLPDGTHPDETGMDYITAAVLDILLTDCNVEAGEHIVHSVTHNLAGAESSLSYYKGISHGKSYVTEITGEDLTVTVTMDGVDITSNGYANGIVSITNVTGDVVITAAGREKTIYDDHLQQLPDNLCCGMNLWNMLTPENQYYTTSGWGNLSTGQAWSITIPVTAGDRIYANSFGKNGSNGNNYSSTSGIRVAYFDAKGVFKSLTPAAVYAEFAANGYLTIPEDVVAVCVPMWTNTDESAVYVLSADHTYENGTCAGCGDHIGPVITQQAESVQQEIGKKFAITVKAEGEGLTYQWYYKDAGMKNFGVSSNKTSSYAYTMQTYMHNRQVYCIITDAYGNSVQTETATITRPPQALKITEQPQDARVNVGEKFSISPKVEGDGLTYQWYVKESGAKAFKVSSNKTSAYAYTMQKYMIGRQVYCVITDKYGNSVTTEVATISLPPMVLALLSQPSDVYAAKGVKFSVDFQVQGDGLTYQWYYKDAGMKNFAKSSNKTSAYAYTMQNYMNNRQVYCVITDRYGNQITTAIATIHLEK